MKRLKHLKRAVALLMAFMLMCTNYINVNAAEDTNRDGYVVYLPFGDSITESTNGYVDIVSRQIGADFMMNGGISGAASYHWLNEMNTNINIKETLKQADVVTITLGSNDIYYKVFEKVASALGCKASEEAISNTINSLVKRYESASGINKVIVGIQLLKVANDVHNALYNVADIKKEATIYGNNMQNIIHNLKSYNPSMDIYVANMYNPYIGTSPVKLGNFTVYDIDEVVELWERHFNTELDKLSGSVKVVDLHSVITSSSQLLCNVNNGSWDPHPNAKGHKDIANAFLKVMD